jgi:hypothetical protein
MSSTGAIRFVESTSFKLKLFGLHKQRAAFPMIAQKINRNKIVTGKNRTSSVCSFIHFDL